MRMQEAARRTGEVEQAAAESAEASVAETGQHAATVRLYVVLCMLRFLCDIYICWLLVHVFQTVIIIQCFVCKLS